MDSVEFKRVFGQFDIPIPAPLYQLFAILSIVQVDHASRISQNLLEEPICNRAFG